MTAKIKHAARGRAHQNKHRPKRKNNRAFEKVYWPYLPIIAVISLLLVFGGQSGAFASAALRHPGGRVLAYATGMSVSGLLDDTNAARSANGIAGLGLNSKLNAAAQAKADDMAARNYWSHNTPEGNPPWIFDDAQGYAYLKLGENLAAGFSDNQATINGWMASAPHRENLLDPAFVEVGFGFANNPDYTSAGGGPMTIVVAHYGKPASTPAPVAAATPPPTPPPASHQASPPPATPAPTPEAPPAGTDTATPLINKTKNAAAAENPKPATTDTSTKGITLSYRASRAQVAFAKLPIASFATGMATFTIFAVIGLWLSRHLLTLRRVFVMGERFVVHHPMVDVGLLVIAGLSFLMTQTAGFIQ